MEPPNVSSVLPEELWGAYKQLREMVDGDRERLAAANLRADKAEIALENLRGDVYLYGIGEITKEQLLGLVEGT